MTIEHVLEIFMEGNVMGNFNTFIAFGVLLVIVSFVIILTTNSASNEKLGILERQLGKLRCTTDKLNQIQRDMAECLRRDPHFTGSSYEDLDNLVKEYNVFRKKIVRDLDDVKQADRQARNALHKHVAVQNVFGGGANDLSAVFYYTKEHKYNKMQNNMPYYRDDDILIRRVVGYMRHFS